MASAEAITEQISTEIHELIIDHLRDDRRSLLACNLVCRSWVPRSRCLLLESMVCRPVPMVSHGGFGKILCAVSYRQGGTDGLIYGTTDGVYRGSENGARLRLLSIHGVSKLEILLDANLFLCLADGVFMSMPLNTLIAGTCHDTDITRISKHASFFDVYRGRTAGESQRVCVLKKSSLSGTIKIFDVSGNQQVSTLVNAQELYIPLEVNSLRFLSSTRLAAALKKGFAVQGGFELVDLTTTETQTLLDPGDSALEFAHKKMKPITVFRVSDLFLVCYDKCGFYIDRRGNMARNKRLMRWDFAPIAFALHDPYLLAFSDMRVEVWNIETAEMVQKINTPYYLLNAPESGEKILALSPTSDDVVEMVFRDHGI
ncbi:CNH domain-containing protein [Mycena rosella]|uniref:CNH domain-containing protein n=1 Tax=Mycena rosella TaxID=1033263 RepID=A0AAD7DTV3_MYCRO|nr:CNH domain-containing protein [Mycena rosella]